ncbi:MAG TPA: site-specific DNA-methyltransferase [Methylotenera sp.]|nr:site-specific DNA-methyltransferase [Methylotenera sp.]HPM49885.1 site-specific DNA-methyltransferase [Methylotenera sp.]
MAKQPTFKTVETLNHEDKRKNIPTAEFQSILDKEQQKTKQIRYPRNTDLDPQLVWRGKDEQDWSDLVVNAPPLYIQEKVHPKALIDDLLRETKEREHQAGQSTADLFSDFNGIPKGADKTEFYQHDQNWTNRMILGDSLQVMASLAEREGLRGKVQCIYFDPPYGIKFDSNFQWSTNTNKVSDGKRDEITREPEQVKAFRDTWKDGIHSYLSYLRDRLTVARDLLSPSGSIFVQIGDENLHRIRGLLDEVFGEENFFSMITLRKLSPLGTGGMANITDYIVWYAKDKKLVKFRPIFDTKKKGGDSRYTYAETPEGLRRSLSKEESSKLENLPSDWKLFTPSSMLSSGFTPTCTFDFELNGKKIAAQKRSWRTNKNGIDNLIRANRLVQYGTLPYLIAYYEDNPLQTMDNMWTDSGSASTSYEKVYVVQTSTRQVQKCLLMATDPGDLVLDPTCGSGTTATVAEQWGRRWITIDTSRVALTLARVRIMGARYPFYLMADSREGQIKEAEITRTAVSSQPVHGNIRHGFVYERVPHIMLSSIASNLEIEVIWNNWQEKLEPLRKSLNAVLQNEWPEWEVPRDPNPQWPDAAKKLHADWWRGRISRQQEIDKSITAKAEFEYLYDKPYEDKKCVRVAGPFTVESMSPHRMLGVDENDELIDSLNQSHTDFGEKQSFPQMILENLKTAGVQQAHKEDRITFTALTPWAGEGLVCAEGRYMEGDVEKRAGVFIGPEFGTVQRSDLVEAARECGDAGFDVLIACAFNYEAHATEFSKLGRIPVLKARMNADLHMAEDLKNTGKGNLFVIFGEPDITLLPQVDGKVSVKVNGVDVFKPQTGEVISDGADGIACWFIDTDYNEESFFVRHAYFLGANDPYSSLKATLKAEIDLEAWETLNSDTSRPFEKPKSGRIAVKVINHLGDEVMKVFKVA